MMTSMTPFNKLLYSATASSSGPPSETQSEISSVDSDWSDIRAIALKLGVQNPDELQTERFKIDRQKLENMIKIDSSVEGLNCAEYFFDNVMKNTTTCISWPCRLKIGAKSKKDPHVRIVGKPEDVQKAKESILASLDSRGTRVIMKMDVSYTDHSYIIGRGGNNIKRIMENTSTHIHFPDSNRSNPTEKSNQVSLCGSLEGVEQARSLVRLSTPLLISFELPVMASGRPVPNNETPYIKEVEAKYNVQVIFSTRPKLHTSLVLVKGAEKKAVRVQEATQLLINLTCENIASQIQVHMQLEISPQHHEIVKGKNSTNLLSIMERTKTKILFPDLSDMNIKPIKKSQVTITGSIDGVYKARQQLIGNLPIALIFDYPDSQNEASEIMDLSTKYGVFISLRQKQRQSTLAVVIKGVEKFIDKVYESHHDILKLSTDLIKPEIPATYFSPKDQDLETTYRRNLTSLLSNYPDSPFTPGFQTNSSMPIFNTNNNNNNNNTLNSYQKFQGTPTGICAPTQKYLQVHNNYHRVQTNHNNNYMQAPASVAAQLSPRNSSNNTSGYQSFSSSTTSLEQAYPPYGSSIGAPRSHYSPDSTYSIEGCRGRRLSDGGLQSVGIGGVTGGIGIGTGNIAINNLGAAGGGNGGGGIAGGGVPGVPPVGSNDYRNPHFDMKQQRAFDFDLKRVVGYKAMERAPQGELRTPNANWIGMGLSRTSPAPLESVDDTASWVRSGGNGTAAGSCAGGPVSPYNLGVTTGLIDSTPTNRRLQLSQHKDIHSLLTSLGLEHYIKTFVLNEIDLEMFTTLTEDNLIELGITAFGARKKILVAIHTLQADETTNNLMTSLSIGSPRFSGSAAPGAERRTSNGW